MVTGFQVIVQPAEFDRHGKLYANHTSDGKTSGSLTVEVEQNGEFLVSIIPVLGGTGIVNSSIEYTELVVVNKATGIVHLYFELTNEIIQHVSLPCFY